MKFYQLKLLLLIFFLFLFQITCEAKNSNSDVLSKIAKSLFNMNYNSQSEDIRLKRIEENVYGATSKSSINVRVNKLSKDLSTDLIGQEIKPKRDSFLEGDEIIVKQPNEDMDFSIVNKLKKKVFRYEFKTIDYQP